jgi:hypothetical protein
MRPVFDLDALRPRRGRRDAFEQVVYEEDWRGLAVDSRAEIIRDEGLIQHGDPGVGRIDRETGGVRGQAIVEGGRDLPLAEFSERSGACFSPCMTAAKGRPSSRFTQLMSTDTSGEHARRPVKNARGQAASLARTSRSEAAIRFSPGDGESASAIEPRLLGMFIA